jgi:predicted O-linked N-acetylglucosamine transferase (SPINDLY family)
MALVCEQEMIAELQRAALSTPRDPEAWRRLGTALNKAGAGMPAILAWTQVTRLDPDDGCGWLGLAKARERLGEIDGAIEAYNRAIELCPDQGAWRLAAARAMPVIMESNKQIARFRAAMAATLTEIIRCPPRRFEFHAGIMTNNFYTAYHNEDDRPLQELLARAHLAVAPGLAWEAPHCHAPLPSAHGRRLKLGVVSSHFHQHSIGKTTIGLVQELDCDRFELTVLRAKQAPDDGLAAAIDAAANRVVVLPATRDKTRRAIADLGLDILFYADIGMSASTYLLAFARLAPVQCVTWGHPDTTGIPNLDYFLSSDCAEPQGAQVHYSEELVRLGGATVCYRRPAVPRMLRDRAYFGLPAEGALYACPHTIFRLHPDFDAVLGEVLRRDPRGRLVFVNSGEKHFDTLLLRRFARTMPDILDRVVMLKGMPYEDFLGLLSLADCVLDAPNFSGHNASLDAFAMGVPVVTWADAQFLRGRFTLGMYKTMSMDECIARSKDNYVSIALRLAHDADFRRFVCQAIAARSPLLFDDRTVVRAHEDFWQDAVERRRVEGFPARSA